MNSIKPIWEFLKGKKTYIIAIAAAIYGCGIQNGWWQHDALIDYLLAGGAAASIRHGIARPAPTPGAMVPGSATPADPESNSLIKIKTKIQI